MHQVRFVFQLVLFDVFADWLRVSALHRRFPPSSDTEHSKWSVSSGVLKRYGG